METPTTLGHVVEKSRVAANGDYNLSGERYRLGVASVSAWPTVQLATVFGRSETTIDPASLTGQITYVGLENIARDTGELTGSTTTSHPAEIRSLKGVFEPGDILYGKLRPNLNKVWLADRPGVCSTDILILRPDLSRAVAALYAYLLRTQCFNGAVMSQIKGAQLPRVGWSAFGALEIPLPPLDVQRAIVAEIEGYQKVIDGARAVVENYRPHIDVDPAWPMVALGEVCRIERGASPRPIHEFMTAAADGINWVKIGDAEIGAKYIDSTRERVTPAGAARSRAVAPGDLVLSNSMSFGRPYIMRIHGCIHDGWLALRQIADNCSSEYLQVVLGAPTTVEQFQRAATGGVVNNLNSELVRRVQVPLPPLATQQLIVAEIEAEQALVAATRELIVRFEKKIEGVLARVWGE